MAKISAAERNYRKWHQKEVDKIEERNYTWPDTVYELGRAHHGVYTSKKWETKDFDYSHYFDSNPMVYSLYGGGPAKSVRKLLGVNNLDGEMILPKLAKMDELTFFDEYNDEARSNPGTNGKKMVKFSSYKPIVSCSDDLKTLILFLKDGPVFIRGGKMHITERGIVG